MKESERNRKIPRKKDIWSKNLIGRERERERERERDRGKEIQRNRNRDSVTVSECEFVALLVLDL